MDRPSESQKVKPSFLFIILIMSYPKENRKCWTEEEDDAILSLVRRYGTKRWTMISEKMRQRFAEEGRSGKQCRQRWHNHLSPAINKEPWTEQELKLVFDSHQKYGNRWTQISQLLPGRTDNSVKNQFYSTLRKGLRRMCKVLGTRNSTTRIKKIKPSVLSALISNMKEQGTRESEMESQIYDLLFSFSSGDRFEELREKTVTEEDKQKIETLLEKILESRDLPSTRRRSQLSKSSALSSQILHSMDEELPEQGQNQAEKQQIKPLLFQSFSKPADIRQQDEESLDNNDQEQYKLNFDQMDDFLDREQEADYPFRPALKKENSKPFDKSEGGSPRNVKKSSSSNEHPYFGKKPSFLQDFENSEGFLTVSPKNSKGQSQFWAMTPKMPTPHTWDSSTVLFSSNDQDHTAVNLDKIADQLIKKIAGNTSRRIL